MADEFLLQYLHCRFANKFLVTSRLFSMGHSLELYSKSALLNHYDYCDLKPTHNIGEFLRELDPSLSTQADVIRAGKKLFSGDTKSFDLELYETHKEALEVYLACEHLRDLKYLVTKNGNLLFPVTVSTVPYNQHFLAIVKAVRGSVASPPGTDQELRRSLELMDISSGECDVV